tara:strand:+ start:309 stop:1295 length:987 start_codon:yes stop_codon:yes gene_type:complete
MTDQQQAVHLRRQAIILFEKYKNVTRVCNILGRSRTWFYKWIGRYMMLGDEGLNNQIRKPCPANRTPMDVEGQVLAVVEQFPSYGPQRIAYLVQRQGVAIGKTAVYGVMKRNKLNRRKDRLEWIRKLNGEIVTKSELETARERSKSRHIEADDPGELVCIDTFYIGCLKGVGRIYQMTGCDAASSFAWAKLYADKSAASAVDFVEHILNNAHGVKLKAVLTDNGKEFTTHWASKKHYFENVLKNKRIKHNYTKVKHPWTNGFAERLNRTILEEFYQVALRKKKYIGIKELQIDLDEFIEFYNFNRPHQGYRLKGSMPSEIFIARENAA